MRSGGAEAPAPGVVADASALSFWCPVEAEEIDDYEELLQVSHENPQRTPETNLYPIPSKGKMRADEQRLETLKCCSST